MRRQDLAKILSVFLFAFAGLAIYAQQNVESITGTALAGICKQDDAYSQQ